MLAVIAVNHWNRREMVKPLQHRVFKLAVGCLSERYSVVQPWTEFDTGMAEINATASLHIIPDTILKMTASGLNICEFLCVLHAREEIE